MTTRQEPARQEEMTPEKLLALTLKWGAKRDPASGARLVPVEAYRVLIDELRRRAGE